MRVSRNRGGAGFSQVIYFKPGEVDQICQEELRKANMLPFEPRNIDIELFIESHLQCQMDFADVPDGIMGYTIFDQNGKPKIVGISPALDDGTSTGRRRTRSTAAHEAGHCILHPTLFMDNPTPPLQGQNLDFERRRILCRDEDFRGSYNGRWWEYQANCAIGGFLMPKPLVTQACEEFLCAEGRLGLRILPASNRERAIKHVSDCFDVSLAAARIRVTQVLPVSEGHLL